MTYKVSIYRDDSITTVVYDNVKHCFWTSGNTVLTLAVYDKSGEHYYIHYLRENVRWYKIEREVKRKNNLSKLK